jgi:phenylpropionate dioxygenase-like ring-hydroxylating dioxygenase large terminal subunit
MSADWLAQLVDSEAGTISAAIYCDEDIYRLELERVFGRSWLCIGHESQIPKAGDFFVSRMGEDPVIMVRQKDGSTRVFLNQCRHRGARICRADLGSARSFTCSYHGWVYDISGELVSVSKEETVNGKVIDKKKWGARQVAKVHIYHGFVFATWNADAPEFDDYLGPTKWYFDLMFDKPGGVEVVGVNRWVVSANWKLAAEQFASDIYHFEYTHAGSIMGMMPEGVPLQFPPPLVGRQFRGNGHGGVVTSHVERSDFETFAVAGPEIVAFNQAQRMRQGELDPLKGKSAVVHANLFPNLGFLPLNQTIRLWQPMGPDKMEIWAWTFIERDAPEELKDKMRRVTQATFASSGIFEQDDAENWAEVQRTLKGMVGQRSLFNNQIGAGEEIDPEGVYPGVTDQAISESAARGLYAHWRDLMLQEG